MCNCTPDTKCSWHAAKERMLNDRVAKSKPVVAQPLAVPTRRLWPIERYLHEFNAIANAAFERPIMVHTKEELMRWLMSRAYNDRMGGL